jgi:hypothetical protein
MAMSSVDIKNIIVMKKKTSIALGKRLGFVIAMINVIPEGEDQPSDRPEERESNDDFGDEESQNINKDPVIGGADDVYSENPSDDLRDSDLVDDEPLQSDIGRAEVSEEELNVDPNDDALGTPFDSEEDDADISNLDDSEDIIDEESDIDDETTI